LRREGWGEELLGEGWSTAEDGGFKENGQVVLQGSGEG